MRGGREPVVDVPPRLLARAELDGDLANPSSVHRSTTSTYSGRRSSRWSIWTSSTAPRVLTHLPGQVAAGWRLEQSTSDGDAEQIDKALTVELDLRILPIPGPPHKVHGAGP